jgi:hypothetical protein
MIAFGGRALTGNRIGLGALIQTFIALVGRHGASITRVALGLVGVDTALEAIAGSSIQMVGSIISMIAIFFFMQHLLRIEDLIERPGGFGSYFGASLLSGLGMIVGAILLIVPGFFLAARWAAATTLTITRNLSAGDALRESWALTKQSTVLLTIVYFVVLALFIALAFGVSFGVTMLAGGEENLVSAAVTNGVVDLGTILGVVLNVAIYIELVGRQTEAEAIFA